MLVIIIIIEILYFNNNGNDKVNNNNSRYEQYSNITFHKNQCGNERSRTNMYLGIFYPFNVLFRKIG